MMGYINSTDYCSAIKNEDYLEIWKKKGKPEEK